MVIQSPNANNRVGAFGSSNLGVDKQDQANGKKTSKTQSGSVTVNGSQLLTQMTGNDKAAKKKEAAQKQAMQVVRDAFSGVKDMKDSIKDARTENDDLRNQNKDIKDQVSELEAERDSLLEKASSDQEKSEIASSFSGTIGNMEKQIADNEDVIKGNIASTRETKKELLKSQAMQDATQQADDIMDAAGKEFVGDLFKDAMDEMEQKRQDEQEETKEKKEEKQKEEEKIQQTKENSSNVPTAENTSGSDSVQQAKPADEYQIIAEDVQADVTKNLQKIMDDELLLPEDLKGIVVDQMQ